MENTNAHMAGGGAGAPQGWGSPPPAGGYGSAPPGGQWGQPPQPGPIPQGGWGGPQPGGYGPPQPAGGAGDLQQKVDRWFVLSIASLFLGCGILGIIPILKASSAKDALHRGDYGKAEADIGTAKLLCILGYVAFGLVVGFYTIFFVVLRMALY